MWAATWLALVRHNDALRTCDSFHWWAAAAAAASCRSRALDRQPLLANFMTNFIAIFLARIFRANFERRHRLVNLEIAQLWLSAGVQSSVIASALPDPGIVLSKVSRCFRRPALLQYRRATRYVPASPCWAARNWPRSLGYVLRIFESNRWLEAAAAAVRCRSRPLHRCLHLAIFLLALVRTCCCRRVGFRQRLTKRAANV